MAARLIWIIDMTPEQQELFDQLTQLQQRTATGVLAGMTQRAAYYAAGGKADTDESADSSCSQILSNIKVKAFMDSMKRQAISDAIMNRDEAMSILTQLARGNLVDIVKFRTTHVGQNAENGDDVHQTTWTIDESLQETDPEKLIIISELEVGKNGPKIKQHSKAAAIALLAKMQGWESAQKVDHLSSDGSMSGPTRIEIVAPSMTPVVADKDDA
jgi:phage terminase small subunit